MSYFKQREILIKSYIVNFEMLKTDTHVTCDTYNTAEHNHFHMRSVMGKNPIT